jgi:hypothetical protein
MIGDYIMSKIESHIVRRCENCNAANARVIMLDGKDGDRYILCPRCLKILKELNNEFENIVSEYTN